MFSPIVAKMVTLQELKGSYTLIDFMSLLKVLKKTYSDLGEING